MIVIKPSPVVIPYSKLKPFTEKITAIAVHCSASTPEANLTAADIHNGHLKRGFSCIGYHYFIDRNGDTYKGRPDNYQGAHIAGHNHYTLGICLSGGINKEGKAENNYTPKQFSALRSLLNELKVKNPTIKKVGGHRDYSPDTNKNGKVDKWEWVKECPCFDANAWYNQK